MKRTIVLVTIIVIALLAATPVLAQTDGESQWGYPLPDPQPVCCYDVEDNPSVCDAYYELHPEELCQDCPDHCEPIAPLPWWKKLVRIVFSIFD